MQQFTQHPQRPEAYLGRAAVESRFLTVSDQDPLRILQGWRLIAQDGDFLEPFFQPEWVAAFSHAFVGSPEVSAITTHRGDTLIGVLPVHYQRSFFGDRLPGHTLRSLSGIHSCRFDLIHKTHEREVVAQSTWRTLRDSLAWTVLELLDVPAYGAANRLLELASEDGFHVGTWSTRRMPFLSLLSHSSPPASLHPRESRVYRARLDSKLRKLRKEGVVTIQCDTVGDVSSIERFIRLEGSGWKGSRGGSINSTPGAAEFYHRIAHAAAKNGYLRIYSLELNGEPISMHFGLLMNGTYYAPKIAYNERFSVYSPGQLLVKLVIESLIKEGIIGYDFLGPASRWKRVWTNATREHRNCYIFRPGKTGKILHTATMRIAPRVRNLKHRIWGDAQA